MEKHWVGWAGWQSCVVAPSPHPAPCRPRHLHLPSISSYLCTGEPAYQIHISFYLFSYLQPLLAPTSGNAKTTGIIRSNKIWPDILKITGITLYTYIHLLVFGRYSDRIQINSLKHFSGVTLKYNGRQVHCALTAVILTVGDIKKHSAATIVVSHTVRHTHTCGSNYTCSGRK